MVLLMNNVEDDDEGIVVTDAEIDSLVDTAI